LPPLFILVIMEETLRDANAEGAIANAKS